MAGNGTGLDEVSFERLLGELYATATDFGRWNTVIDMLTRYSGCVNANFTQLNLNSSFYRSVGNLDDAVQATYSDYYHAVNPVWPVVFNAPAGSVNTDEMVLRKDDFLRGEFFNDWVRPQGVYTSLTIAANSLNEGQSFLGLYSPREFTDGEVEFFRRLAPHVVKAVSISHRIMRLERNGRFDRQLLDGVATGVVVVDMTARVIFANARARSLFGPMSPFMIRHGRLQMANPRDVGTLARAIAACIGSGLGTSLNISRSPPAWPLRLTITAGAMVPTGHGSEKPVATILIEDQTPANPQPDLIRQRFGLTQTEAQIAAAIASGLGIDGTAKVTGISRNTVRAHLRSIYQQTHTHSQAELIKAVLS